MHLTMNERHWDEKYPISGFALPRWSPKSLPREMLPEDEEEEEEEEQVIAGETDLDNCGDLYP